MQWGRRKNGGGERGNPRGGVGCGGMKKARRLTHHHNKRRGGRWENAVFWTFTLENCGKKGNFATCKLRVMRT